MIVDTPRKERVSRSKTKANSPYSSIQNRISIDRNKTKIPQSTKKGGSKKHGRASCSLVNMKPVANIDSVFDPKNRGPSKDKVMMSFQKSKL